MKKIILIIILIGSQIGFSQELKETEKLSSLCKIWGFLKYYHPTVAKGNFNWDEQLLTILPKIKQSKNKEDLSKIYLDWIESLGVIKVCKSCNDVSKKEYFEKNFNLTWIQNTEMFTDELSKKLKYIENNRIQGNNYYVSSANEGNIEVKNEPKYENFEFPNENYRLLNLFKYWNIIEYFYPYKYLTDENWNDVLNKMIPKIIDANNATEYQLTMLETVIKLDDTHAFFYTDKINDFFGNKWIPAYFKIIENKAIITNFYSDSLAKLNDIQIGDVIEQIDGKTINDILREKIKYIHGSNYNTKLKNSYKAIFNGTTDSVKITLNRNGILYNKTARRYSRENFKHKNEIIVKYKILAGNIGYADMTFLEMKDVDKMMLELKSTKAIIIDYRKFMNFIPYLIARRLIKTDKEFLKLIEPDLSYPGKFNWKKTNVVSPMKNEYYSGKVIVLVNEHTQSASEYATMLLQTGDSVTTIGSQTAGADGDVSHIDFFGFKSYISGLGVFYPDGTETQRKGIKINIEVHPTIKGIQEQKDEVLGRAIEFINNKK